MASDEAARLPSALPFSRSSRPPFLPESCLASSWYSSLFLALFLAATFDAAAAAGAAILRDVGRGLRPRGFVLPLRSLSLLR